MMFWLTEAAMGYDVSDKCTLNEFQIAVKRWDEKKKAFTDYFELQNQYWNY